MTEGKPAGGAIDRGRLKGRGGRGDPSPLGTWFWDIDRVLLLLALFLIAIGLLAVAAGSPASAMRYSGEHLKFEPLHYFWRQTIWVAVSLPVLFGVSMLPVQLARRMALVGAAVCIACLVLMPFIGMTVNGAKRWIGFGFAQFQPSEFLKPFFVVTVAWLLSLKSRDQELPVTIITAGLTGVIALLLMLQPDFGQTVIFCLIWLALVTIAGTPTKTIMGFVALVPAGLVAAYLFYGTARSRIDAFLFPGVEGEGAADHFQTNAAHATLTAGGWFGTGPGGGTVKFGLPEAHTDYIYSVIGEEFGLLACMIVALVFLALVVRVFVKLLDEQDPFKLLAASGLAVQFGAQALVSMAVNTGLAPSKGMTLPFISYGGSSMVALSIGMGLLLAFTRRNPFLMRSPYITRWNTE
ncbi:MULTISPECIES: FtsW/RodA/SpoVE family cell cycle protein [Sphingomonas]|uniref:Probable peptidoglycan glycosyltransferase FtsW n=1 Tax=Sphingomonas adhaesiva TaxID=28212 RepID=A0A2A4I9W9_9SPHN|nr:MULTISPECIES: putative peptidoglycan glycosyltransferase FtsW [Sphingomonas]PCG14948.1 cell division protein FtsW [Sphingomonas adhaesiva]PZU81353.1 MAG: cell division protein FtsW [Sphingomonas sp.]